MKSVPMEFCHRSNPNCSRGIREMAATEPRRRPVSTIPTTSGFDDDNAVVVVVQNMNSLSVDQLQVP